MENFTSGFAVGPLEHDGIVLSSSGEGRMEWFFRSLLIAYETFGLKNCPPPFNLYKTFIVQLTKKG
ncbi:hypothetical protein NX722_07270 [Endozoicomonas gorgoniicola]|uniref:Uncharacterized protein n=1 Tax=Endozoicomonas gorgoniicola TaxID=1234144 RepID=A0ABT3MST6_9GAMM|nr:hypothetical protein [Endozoicomonas gorgoniicola]MCW7552446.1 hypothetical protein [Endozoicomonas gorgoniicola]